MSGSEEESVGIYGATQNMGVVADAVNIPVFGII